MHVRIYEYSVQSCAPGRKITASLAMESRRKKIQLRTLRLALSGHM